MPGRGPRSSSTAAASARRRSRSSRCPSASTRSLFRHPELGERRVSVVVKIGATGSRVHRLHQVAGRRAATSLVVLLLLAHARRGRGRSAGLDRRRPRPLHHRRLSRSAGDADPPAAGDDARPADAAGHRAVPRLLAVRAGPGRGGRARRRRHRPRSIRPGRCRRARRRRASTALFAQARERALPGVLRQRLAAARALYAEKSYDAVGRGVHRRAPAARASGAWPRPPAPTSRR